METLLGPGGERCKEREGANGGYRVRRLILHFNSCGSHCASRSMWPPHVRAGERVRVLCILVHTKDPKNGSRQRQPPPGMRGEADTLIRDTAFSKKLLAFDRQEQRESQASGVQVHRQEDPFKKRVARKNGAGRATAWL